MASLQQAPGVELNNQHPYEKGVVVVGTLIPVSRSLRQTDIRGSMTSQSRPIRELQADKGACLPQLTDQSGSPWV